MRAAELERGTREFLERAVALRLSWEEQRALLDLTPTELTLLRLAPANAFQLGGAKLERRVTYALSILQRMTAALAS